MYEPTTPLVPEKIQPDKIQLVRQKHSEGCGIACVAMIASVSYEEAWDKLAPPPVKPESANSYAKRELAFLWEKGWSPSAQLVLRTVINLKELDSIIDEEEGFKSSVERSQRVRLILAFADGAKPDHAVIWDRKHKDIVFDPSRGEVPISELFNDAGPQTYSGTLGFAAFCYQPGQHIQPLVKTEKEGAAPQVAPSADQ
jgi:hypothetical protein